MSLAEAFLEQMNDWHTYPEPYEDIDLDHWLHKSYADVLLREKKIDWSVPYFSPSGASKQLCELYAKAKRFKKDKVRWKPHQRRYMSQGTALGDWLQRDIMLCERYYEKLSGKKPRFVMGLVNGEPAFENFIFKQHKMSWKGKEFSLLGTSDGIMVDTHTGEKVLLEVKSKQSTPAKTSLYSMREAEPSHIKQVVCYGEMYDVKRAIIVYVNGAKEGWFADDEKLKKTPDLRAFDVEITEELREEVFDHFVMALEVVESGRMPIPDLRDWEFSEYKQAIVEELSDEDFESMIRVAEAYKLMSEPFVVNNIDKALADVRQRRKAIEVK